MEQGKFQTTLYTIDGKKRILPRPIQTLEELRNSDQKIIDFEDDLKFLVPHSGKDIFPNIQKRENNIIVFPK